MKKVTFGKMRPISGYRGDGSEMDVYVDGEDVGSITSDMYTNFPWNSCCVVSCYDVEVWDGEDCVQASFDVDLSGRPGLWQYKSEYKSEHKTARAALKAAKDYVRHFYNK